METGKRRIPFEEEWFSKELNDTVYGFMQLYGEQYKENGLVQVKLQKKIFNLNLDKIKGALCVKDKRTIMAAIKKFKDKGYVTEDEYYYYFPYDPNNRYALVNKDVLEALTVAMSHFTIKIYVYLKYRSIKPDYLFTLKELKMMMGYSENTRGVESDIGICLGVLEQLGLIKFEKVYVSDGNERNYKIPNYKLIEVSDNLPPKIIQEKENAQDKVDEDYIKNFTKDYKHLFGF